MIRTIQGVRQLVSVVEFIVREEGFDLWILADWELEELLEATDRFILFALSPGEIDLPESEELVRFSSTISYSVNVLGAHWGWVDGFVEPLKLSREDLSLFVGRLRRHSAGDQLGRLDALMLLDLLDLGVEMSRTVGVDASIFSGFMEAWSSVLARVVDSVANRAATVPIDVAHASLVDPLVDRLLYDSLGTSYGFYVSEVGLPDSTASFLGNRFFELAMSSAGTVERAGRDGWWDLSITDNPAPSLDEVRAVLGVIASLVPQEGAVWIPPPGALKAVSGTSSWVELAFDWDGGGDPLSPDRTEERFQETDDGPRLALWRKNGILSALEVGYRRDYERRFPAPGRLFRDLRR